ASPRSASPPPADSTTTSIAKAVGDSPRRSRSCPSLRVTRVSARTSASSERGGRGARSSVGTSPTLGMTLCGSPDGLAQVPLRHLQQVERLLERLLVDALLPRDLGP